MLRPDGFEDDGKQDEFAVPAGPQSGKGSFGGAISRYLHWIRNIPITILKLSMEGDHPSSPIRQGACLALFCFATVCLIPLESFLSGSLAWLLSLAVAVREPPPFRRRMSVLLLMIFLLALAPINTDRRTFHFFSLGSFFLAVICIPTLLLARTDPGVIEWRLLPRRFNGMDIAYTLISIPLAWAVIQVYFFQVNPDVAANWPMPHEPDPDALWRLFLGINAVGIWDELFFVNTVYGILRSIFPARVANVAQAVVYASVLNDMAFTGIGPMVVYVFALTQGFMYEKSRNLLFVLIVHLIVDAFLVAAILQYHYPGMAIQCF